MKRHDPILAHCQGLFPLLLKIQPLYVSGKQLFIVHKQNPFLASFMMQIYFLEQSR